jgi:hypothetical protein
MHRDLAPFRRVLLTALLAVVACAALPTLASAAALETSPSSVTFSQEIVGKRSLGQTITVQANSPVSDTVIQVYSLNSGDFPILADGCEFAVVQEGQPCQITVAFEPQAGGTRLGSIEIETLAGGPLIVPLEGQGLTKQVTVPAATSFPVTTLGSSVTSQVTLSNQSEAGLELKDVKVEGANAGDFVLEGPSCNGFLGAGNSCQLTVRFSPGAEGAREAQLKVVSDGVPVETFGTLSGEGAVPQLSFEPASYDFGLSEVHGGGSQTSLTLRNTGLAAVQVGNIEITGPDTNEFYTPYNGCSGASLGVGQTCTIGVQFNANNEGSFEAAVRASVGGVSFEAPLEARAEQPKIESSAFPLSFAPTSVGGSGQERELTLTNTGNLPIGFFIAILSGGDVSSFQLLEESCTGRLIAPGESCAVTIRFRPQRAGAKHATASFFGNGEGAMQVPLEGVGTAPKLTLSPDSHDFGSVAAGAAGPIQVFQLRNESGDPYAVDSVGLAGADLGEFSIRSDDCTEAELPPGEGCAVAVRFDPESAGAKAATLRLRGNAGTTVARLSGNATATAPAAASAPAPAAAGRVVLALQDKPRVGGKRVVIGRARCDSSQACEVSLGGRATGKLATASGWRPATRPLLGSRQTIPAGGSVPLTVFLPAQLRQAPSGKKLTVTLHWRTGSERGQTTRTITVPR